MSADAFAAPTPLPDPDAPVFDRNGIERSKDGRPYVKELCPDDEGDHDGPCRNGRVPGVRKGTTKKCPTCKGRGHLRSLYTRCTTFVGALEDRQNLEAWQKRIVLLGMKASEPLRERLDVLDIDDREGLDALAADAYEAGDGHRAAQKGTDLHALTERHDTGDTLPDDVSLDDRRDLAAWCRLLEEHRIDVLDVEVFVVDDEHRIGGTYDRRVVCYEGWARCQACQAEGFNPFRPRILDLKTGRIDYGAGKIAQQLAVYANSDRYEPEVGRRSQNLVCRHVAYVAHLPQGTGTASLHAVDIVQGWAAVQLSAQVREHRRVSKSWLVPVGGIAFEVTR